MYLHSLIMNPGVMMREIVEDVDTTVLIKQVRILNLFQFVLIIITMNQLTRLVINSSCHIRLIVHTFSMMMM